MNKFSSFDNKNLEKTAMEIVQGGRRSITASVIYSNFLNAQGHQNIDTYNQYSVFANRIWFNSSDYSAPDGRKNQAKLKQASETVGEKFSSSGL